MEKLLEERVQVKVKKLLPEAIIPQYAKDGDAGLDIVATSIEEKDGRIVYGTGLSFEIPKGYLGFLMPRSSICKHDLRLTNAVGLLDSSFRGEVKFIFENDAMQQRGSVTDTRAFWDATKNEEAHNASIWPVHKVYKVGDRIGQLVILPYPQIELVESETLSDTERGSGGFGSTGA